MKLFVVKMERYGDYHGHAYIIGVYSNPHLASLAGKAEQNYRGNKYYPNIIEIDFNGNLTDQISLIKTWEETELGSIRKLEFKIIDAGHSPEFNDNLLQTQKFTVELVDIIKEITISSDDELEDLHCNLGIYSNEELEILRDIHEKYIRKKLI